MTATETTRRCSSDNPFAYNETLTVLCEQGIAGLLCVTVFWVFVVRGLKIFISIRQQVGFLVSCSVFIGFLPVLLSFGIWSFVCLLPLMPAIGLGRGRAIRWRMASWLNIYHRRLLSIVASCVCCALLVFGFVLRWRSQVWINDYSVFATSSERPGRVVGGLSVTTRSFWHTVRMLLFCVRIMNWHSRIWMV